MIRLNDFIDAFYLHGYEFFAYIDEIEELYIAQIKIKRENTIKVIRTQNYYNRTSKSQLEYENTSRRTPTELEVTIMME